ncbi:MAG: hypothetical protein U0930_18855 [Pirellulales bacterium]
MRLPLLLIVHCGAIIAFVAQSGLAFQTEVNAGPLDRVELRQGISETTKIGIWNPLKVLNFEGQIQTLDAKSLTISVLVEGKPTPKTLPSEQVQRIVPT